MWTGPDATTNLKLFISNQKEYYLLMAFFKMKDSEREIFQLELALFNYSIKRFIFQVSKPDSRIMH